MEKEPRISKRIGVDFPSSRTYIFDDGSRVSTDFSDTGLTYHLRRGNNLETSMRIDRKYSSMRQYIHQLGVTPEDKSKILANTPRKNDTKKGNTKEVEPYALAIKRYERANPIKRKR